MNAIKGWLKRLGESPGLILKLLLLMAVAGLLGHAGVAPALMDVIVGWLCFSVSILGALTLYVAAFRKPEHEDPLPLVFRPGEPGRRTWKHNVYGENAYAILGVPQNAARHEIRDAFKKLVQKYHPDAAPPEEKERAALVFVRLDEAYELLSHPENRARYDAWIEHLRGEEPPLDQACQLFRDPAAREQFDREILKKDCEMAQAPGQHVESEPVCPVAKNRPPGPYPAASASEGHNRADPAEGKELSSPCSPAEVEIPDAVREALGLPRTPPRAGGNAAT